jgi:hypothetical protein
MTFKKTEDEVQQELIIALGRIILNTVGDSASPVKAETAGILPILSELSPDEVVSSLRGAATQCDQLSRTAPASEKRELEAVGFGLAVLASELEKKNRIPET